LLNITTTHVADKVLNKFHVLEDEAISSWTADLRQVFASHLESGTYQDIFKEVIVRLDSEFTDNVAMKSRIRELIPGLLGPQVTSLDFSCIRTFLDKVITKTVYTNMDKCCPKLERLYMGKSFFFCPELVSDMNSKLSCFPRLMSLKIEYIAIPEMLENISKICPKLMELSLKGSSKIGDETTENLLACSNLLILDIQGTGISGSGCLKIIEACPRLEWIEHCPFNCDSDLQIFKSRKEMFDMIKKVYIESKNNNEGEELSEIPQMKSITQFKIKNFWLFNPKSEELIVSLLCPRLEKIRLDFVFQDMSYSLDASPLSSFKYLDTLDLNFYDSHNADMFTHILNVCGFQLTNLIFNVCSDYNTVVDCHNIIARTCPNLTSLSFIGDYENPSHIDREIDSLLIAHSPEYQPHTKLRNLTLGGYCTNGRFSWMLASARNIQNIKLDGNLEKLGDAGWTDVMADNSLQQLETVWFNTSTAMTMTTVNRLVEQCPRLRRLGRLVHLVGHEGGARRGDYTDLVDRAKMGNWDMDFVWVTPAKKIT